jgi:hypothetical protein
MLLSLGGMACSAAHGWATGACARTADAATQHEDDNVPLCEDAAEALAAGHDAAFDLQVRG